MVRPTTKPMDFTLNPLLVDLMLLQDEVGWVDAEPLIAQMADLQVKPSMSESSALVPQKQPGKDVGPLIQSSHPHYPIPIGNGGAFAQETRQPLAPLPYRQTFISYKIFVSFFIVYTSHDDSCTKNKLLLELLTFFSLILCE